MNPKKQNSENWRVDFLIVGAQRSGTTALASFLRQHPQLVLSNKGEGHFFDKDEHFETGSLDYQQYHSHFGPVGVNQRAGEKTPTYMYFPACASRIKTYNPDVRLIFILRDPSERTFSQWRRWQRGGGNEDFSCMIRRLAAEIAVSDESVSRGPGRRGFIKRSLYSEQIRRFTPLFRREQMLFLRNEDLREKRAVTLSAVTEFLDVPPFESQPASITAPSDAPMLATMDAQDRKFLVNLFYSSILELEDLLDWECGKWRT